MTSEVTERARTIVAERLPEARALGQTLAELIDYPEEFMATLERGLISLSDAMYTAELGRVVPGDTPDIAVRTPLTRAVARRLARPLAEGSSASALYLAERLADSDKRSIRLFALEPLGRALEREPERSWQLLRRMAHAARDWLSVDSLAAVYARGILLEPVRWAEIEQLVFSSSEWERRLVGATIASLPMRLNMVTRRTLIGTPALALIRSLIGDASDTVQKSLAWALRAWREIDRAGVDDLLREEAALAASTGDGHRARVIREAVRDARPTPSGGLAAELRERLAGIRRTSNAESTSTAADIRAHFAGLDQLTEHAVAQQGQRQRHAEGVR